MKAFIIIFAFLTVTISEISANAHTLKLNIDTLKKGKNYILFNKSNNIAEVIFNKNKKSTENTVYIHFGFPKPMPTSNTVSGTVLQSNRKYTEDGSLPIFDKIDIIKGNYSDIKLEKETNFKNLFTLSNVVFPLHLKIKSGNEIIQFELTELGKWDIDIELKNN